MWCMAVWQRSPAPTADSMCTMGWGRLWRLPNVPFRRLYTVKYTCVQGQQVLICPLSSSPQQ